MSIYVLNGPPGSGKDTIADWLVDTLGFTKLEMKGPLRQLAHKIASLQVENPVEFCNALEFDEALKSKKKVAEFGNRTWREFLIWLSEEVCKPIFGKSIFAMAVAKAMKEQFGEDAFAQDVIQPNIVFSDLGFPVELEVLDEELGSMARTVFIIRPGKTFDGDSRSYICSSNPNRPMNAIVNSGSKEDAFRAMENILIDWGHYDLGAR